MKPEEHKKRKQDLGIFYTPPEVVSFIFDVLNLWKGQEDKESQRWNSRKPRAHYPSVVDPAVGEGVFLKEAVASGFTKPDWIFGLDIDENAVKKWKEINLLAEFGGNEKDLEAHFFHQNGLLDIKWEQHSEKYKGKLRTDNLENQQFDAVVGNPPYGGIGVDFKDTLNVETRDLIKALKMYELLALKGQKQVSQSQQSMGFTNAFQTTNGNEQLLLAEEVMNIAPSTPIEILFVERFIRLAKPGGSIAIIIPDGILTNSNSHYVREYISRKTKVEAIISLPRGTFQQAGTTAKTSILFLKKVEKEGAQPADYSVFLAAVENINSEDFKNVFAHYQQFISKNKKTMNKKNLVQIIKDQTGKEAVMVRVDKTLREMMEEKPSSRWDPGYWHPKSDELMNLISSSRVKFAKLGSLFPSINQWLISTDHVRASRGEQEGDKYPVEYYTPANLLFTGYDVSTIPHCTENAFGRMSRARPMQFDLLLGGFGMGPTGKSVVLWQRPSAKSIVGNIFILRLKKNYSPYVLDVFLKSIFGKGQLDRVKIGVAINKLSNDQIANTLVPIFSSSQIKSIESVYKRMTVYHDKATGAKKKGDEDGYKKNIEKAEKMLKDLIAKTEAVIRGERKDVI